MPKTQKAEQVGRIRTSATQRLVNVLDEMSRTTTSNNVAVTLVSVMKIKTEDPNRSALLAFSALTRMIEIAETEAHKHHPDMWDTLGPHFSGVRKCFAPQTSGARWDQHKPNLTDRDVSVLRSEAGHLRRHVPELPLTEDELGDVVTALNQMEEAIQQEALYERTRTILTDCLARIRESLDEYRFWGAGGIEQAYREFVGAIQINVTLRSEVDKKPKDGRFWTVTLALCMALSGAIARANDIVEFKQATLPAIERFLIPAPPTSISKKEAEPQHSPAPAVTIQAVRTEDI